MDDSHFRNLCGDLVCDAALPIIRKSQIITLTTYHFFSFNQALTCVFE
jgi:hypothetical protein